MKKLLVGVFIIFCSLTFAQWDKVNDYNVGVAGKLVEHNNSVYLYGDDGPFYLYRSDDNGSSWIDLSAQVPDDGFSEIYSFNGKLYAVWLSTVYTSDDAAESWTAFSSVFVTGNGAVTGFAHDGATLFAYSNRKSIFKSVDTGLTWEEIFVNDPNNILIVDFASVGNVFVAIIANVGAYVSTDAGASWAVNQPTTALSGVFSNNNEIFGLSFSDGIYKYDFQANTWIKKSNGLPSDGVFVIPKTMLNVGTTLFVSYIQLLGNSGVASSGDFGETWNIIPSEGRPVQNSNSSITANSSHLFEYYYGIIDAASGGTYRTQITVSSLDDYSEQLTNNYILLQNYPNPFNPTTTISFTIPQSTHVSLKIYDSLGAEVAELINRKLNSGTHSVVFNAQSELSSGIYFYRLESNNYTQTKKLILIK